MIKKNLQLIHKEQNSECFEILKSSVFEDEELKKYKIDKNTLLHELPEKVVNEFLDFLGTGEQHRNLMLQMIKNGTLIMECWEDEEYFNELPRVSFKNENEKSFGFGDNNFWNISDNSNNYNIPF